MKIVGTNLDSKAPRPHKQGEVKSANREEEKKKD